MKNGDKVRHKSMMHQYKGVGEVGFISGNGWVFVKWPNADVKTYPAYYKPSSLEIIDHKKPEARNQECNFCEKVKPELFNFQNELICTECLVTNLPSGD